MDLFEQFELTNLNCLISILPGLKLFPPGPLVVQLLAAGSQGLDLLLQALDKSGISIKDESSLIILVIVSELYLSNLSL